MSPSIVVVGGGPAGLTAATLLKSRRPERHVRLLERQRPEDTFGYGVGLGHAALTLLRSAAPQLASDVEAISSPIPSWTIRRDDDSFTATNDHGRAVSRERLLQTLRHNAVRAGVEVCDGVDASLADTGDADLVIAADGVGSAIRRSLGDEIGARVEHGRLAYVWCGSSVPPDGMTFAIVRTPHGPMTAHVMPYASDAATFQVDALQSVVADAGADTDGTATLRFLDEGFAQLLQGTSLRAKRPQWQTFGTVVCERLSAGNVVLIGDAAHTAHYTVGSGTALAMEDAIVLADALDGEASVAAAFAAYEQVRRPRVARIQDRARRSQLWWSSLALRVDAPLSRLLLSHLTRTGALTLADMIATNAPMVDACLPGTSSASDPATHVLETAASPVTAPAHRVVVDRAPCLDWLDHVVETVAAQAHPGSTVCVEGPDTADAVLDRLDVAEQLRARAQVHTRVRASVAHRDALAVGVLTGRTDSVELREDPA